MHRSRKDIIQVSDKTSMPLAAVFSQEVINKKTQRQEEDIFPLGLGLSSAMLELSVTAGHAITCLIYGKI